MLLTQFQAVGRDLFAKGMISSNNGSMSIRSGDKLVITRRGSMLNNLGEQDIIETGINKNDRATPLAPTELAVHRSIYRLTPALAVIHAHPPHAIALSLAEALAEGQGCIIGPDGFGARRERGAGVQAGVHAHQRHARFRVPGEDGGGDRGRAAMPRQQRGMEVQAPARRQVEHGGLQNLSKRGDDDDLRLPGREPGQGLRLGQSARLNDGQPGLAREQFHG